MVGRHFEREIYEQPEVWRRVAHSDGARRLAGSLVDDIVLIGSGSSLFVAQLGAKALRRRGVTAHALAASEAFNDNAAYRGKTIVAISQSGRSTDVLAALDALRPARMVALTNSPESPLARRANVTIDSLAGRELAVPATKSVTAMALLLLCAASIVGGDLESRSPHAIVQAAATVDAWLNDGGAQAAVAACATRIASLSHLIFLGTDYGAPIAREAALKFKEATYMHAEGFESGEFRHGSAAMIDASSALACLVDDDGRELALHALDDVRDRAGYVFAVGGALERCVRIGPDVDRAFTVLGWLVAVQCAALQTARVRGIESDTPRGLRKALEFEPNAGTSSSKRVLGRADADASE